jgi:hypothetical protein
MGPADRGDVRSAEARRHRRCCRDVTPAAVRFDSPKWRQMLTMSESAAEVNPLFVFAYCS